MTRYGGGGDHVTPDWFRVALRVRLFPLDHHHPLHPTMNGSSNIPLPSFRTTLSTGKKEPDQPKLLPFSFKRQDPVQIQVQKQRNNSPKPGFFDNPNPRVNNNSNDLIQTQSFRLPENVSYKPPIKNSKPFFPSQAHPDPSQLNRRPNSQISRPIFGSHIKAPLKIEENASIEARESSPLAHQAHILTSDEADVDIKQYPLLSTSGIHQPFSSLVANSSASRITDRQQFAHSNDFVSSSSSYPVQNFPESPSEYPLLRLY